MEIERRTNNVELRVVSAGMGKKPVISGYAAKFNTLSESMPIMHEGEQIGTFREQLAPGCFATAIPTSDIRALINHEPSLILGRTTSGTLRVSEDTVGLAFENDPPNTSYANDLQVSMQRGDITQCSFGFSVADGGDTYSKDSSIVGGYIRTINRMKALYDVSPVTYPAYKDTNCAMRSLVGLIQTEKTEIEQRTAAKLEEDRIAAELIETEKLETERLAEETRAAEEAETLRLESEKAEEQRKLEVETEKLKLQLLELEMDI